MDCEEKNYAVTQNVTSSSSICSCEDYFTQFSSNNAHSFTYLPESVEELFFTEELERNKHQLWPLIL